MSTRRPRTAVDTVTVRARINALTRGNVRGTVEIGLGRTTTRRGLRGPDLRLRQPEHLAIGGCDDAGRSSSITRSMTPAPGARRAW